MSRALLLRLLLSSLLILCCARLLWTIIAHVPSPELPLRIEHPSQESPYTIHARADMPLPAPLAEGQVVDMDRMQPADRATLLFPGQTLKGTPFTLYVSSGKAPLGVRLETLRPPYSETVLGHVGEWSGSASYLFLLAISLLTLWRGRDGTVVGLLMLSCGILLVNTLLSFTFPPLLAFGAMQLGRAISLLLINPSVYVMARFLVGRGLSPGWLRLARNSVLVLSVLTFVAQSVHQSAIVFGWELPAWLGALLGAAGWLVIPVILIPLLVLVMGYPGAGHEHRLRIRWVLCSTALLLAAGIGQAMMTEASAMLLRVFFGTLLPGAGVLGYLYAILRTRVVDVTVVIDRALVYSVITAFVFGVFSLMEQLLHRFAAGEELGWALQAITVVLLAAVLSPLHRLLDRALERVFFHDLRSTVSSLKQLAAQAVFYEKEETLLGRVLAQLQIPCAAVALYERRGGAYERRVAHGEGWPERVDADDPLFVGLRAGRQELDLATLRSTAGPEGRAFPMGVGPRLTGAVICLARPGEQLDREVRAGIAELARSVGTSLYLLQYAEQSRLLVEIAAGSLDPAAARTRAAALMVAA